MLITTPIFVGNTKRGSVPILQFVQILLLFISIIIIAIAPTSGVDGSSSSSSPRVTTSFVPSSSSSSLPTAPTGTLSSVLYNARRRSFLLHGTTNNNNNNNNMSHNTNEDNDDDEDVKAYNSCISNAVDITNTYVRNGLVTLTRSARDVDSNVRRNFLYHIPLPPPPTSTSIPPSPPLLSIPPPTETSVKSLCRIPSPSGNQVAIFLEEEDPSNNNNNNNNKKQIIEVWTEGGQTLSNRILLPTQKLHGKVCTDTSWFGGFSWHSSSSFNNNNNNQEEDVVEEFLVYVAEALPPSTKSFFHHRTTSGDDEDDTAGSSSSITGGEYTLGLGKGEDWGEKYTSTHRLNLYCVHLPTGNVGMVSNVPGAAATTTTTEGGYVLGQPTFSPCGAYIVYTGWDAGGGGEMPRRLGSVYCYQRRSKIYSSRVSTLLNRLAGRSGTSEKEEEDGVEDGGFVCVTPDDQLARSPRFSSTTTTTTSSSSDCKLIYLCNTKGFDTHGGCMGLHVMDWKNIAAGGGGGGLSIQSRREVVKPVFDFPSIVREDDDDDDAGGGVGMNMNLEFPGLFVDQLPNHPCTSPDGMYLYTTTQWGCRRRIIRISLDDGAITPIQFDIRNGPNSSSSDGDDEGDNGRKMASQTLLCLTDNGDAIVSQSTPNSPPTVGFLPSRVLQMADDDDDDGGSKAGGVVLVNPLIKFGAIAATSAFAPFSHVSSSTTTIKGDDRIQCFGIVASPQEGKDGPDVEGILLLPPPDSNNNNDNKNDDAKNTKKIPLLVIPHGGPHSCSTTTFIPSYAFLCKQGYAILHTNFRGSTGYGQSFVESLAGSIGRSDVDDVVALTQRALTFQQSHSHLQQLDANRVGVCGGSHGGFLAGHLIGQHPKLFKVAAMRNMVSNIAGMVTHTDIPDWCYVEGMGIGSYDWKEFRGPKRDELGLMWDKSPIAHIDKVTAPTLVALGMADKRVPPSQGIEYYHALRSKGVKTKLLIYEKDDHAIDRVVSEADHWLNIKRWFDEHL